MPQPPLMAIATRKLFSIPMPTPSIKMGRKILILRGLRSSLANKKGGLQTSPMNWWLKFYCLSTLIFFLLANNLKRLFRIHVPCRHSILVPGLLPKLLRQQGFHPIDFSRNDYSCMILPKALSSRSIARHDTRPVLFVVTLLSDWGENLPFGQFPVRMAIIYFAHVGRKLCSWPLSKPVTFFHGSFNILGPT